MWEQGLVNKNLWKKLKRLLKDMDRQATKAQCRGRVALEIQNNIKGAWGREPYLECGVREITKDLSWFRLGAWRARINEDRLRICLLCGDGESYFG